MMLAFDRLIRNKVKAPAKKEPDRIVRSALSLFESESLQMIDKALSSESGRLDLVRHLITAQKESDSIT